MTFEPNFKTSPDKFCKEEINKLNSNGMTGTLAEELRNDQPDISWEAEQLAKSHGFYLEFNRASTGREKDWSYMIRLSIPGGGPITKEQWKVFDDIANKFGVSPDGTPSIRLTTRQTIQYHWVKKENLIELIQTVAKSGIYAINGCGDNVRNVMACPLSRYSKDFNGIKLASKVADYFRLPTAGHIQIFAIDPTYLRNPDEAEKSGFKYGANLLNRKFKIAIGAVDSENGILHQENCVEALTNDLSIIPIIEDNQVKRFQIYIGGGQGEKNGKPTVSTLGKPLTITTEENIIKYMDAIVSVHQEWGDRENRHWARIKYVVKKLGTEWFRERISEKLGYKVELPIEDLDVGPRKLHHGWEKQGDTGLWCYGVFIENGRLVDNSPNGKVKTMVLELVEKYNLELMITANQDLIFSNISENIKADFEKDLLSYGYGKRNGKEYSTLRLHSGACVGRDTCRLTYTDSEKFEPFLIDELESLGWGDLKESIGITGCERQCFRPGTKSIGLVGTGLNRYQFKLYGSEDGRFQGKPLYTADQSEIYLKSVPRESVPVVIDALFKLHASEKQENESFGYFTRRIGGEKIISYLKENPVTADLMKPFEVKTEVIA